MTKENTITPLAIEKMIALFIDKSLENEVLNEIFQKAITDKEAHITKVANFWKSLLLDTDDYKENTFNHSHEGLEVDKDVAPNEEGYALKKGIRVKKPISKEHFDNWIKCFKESADEVFSSDISDFIVNKADTIGKEMHHMVKNS